MFSIPAFVELAGGRDGSYFATLEDVMRSPVMQSQVLDKRAFRRVVAGLRKRGRIVEIPYIGPVNGRR